MGCPAAAAMLELSTPLCQLVTLDAGGVRGGVCRREGGGGGVVVKVSMEEVSPRVRLA